jgi:spore germination cell wall hydrolase CwlJ-like protein
MRKAKLILISSILALCTMVGIGGAMEQNMLMNIAYSDLTKDARKQVDCLAENIYHEAGFEPEKGKQAVALVTLNRTHDTRFPSQICEVVKQKTQGTCQFSWFCMPVKIKKDSDAFKQSMEVALFVYANYEKLKDVTNGALYYHADYVNPRWRNVEKTTVIGRHIFYKEKLKS